MKTILAPIDFSPVSQCVIAEAIALARAVHGRVVLLHVVEPEVIVNAIGAVATVETPVALEKAAAIKLACLKMAEQRSFRAISTVRLTGGPVAEITAYAEKTGADFIVLGSHGHTAFYNLLLGSTASGVLERAHCPVLVVPPVKPFPPRTRKNERMEVAREPMPASTETHPEGCSLPLWS